MQRALVRVVNDVWLAVSLLVFDCVALHLKKGKEVSTCAYNRS
jgi:hypothetical protein